MATNGDQRLSEQLRNVPAGVPALDPMKQAAHQAELVGDDFMVRIGDVAAAARHIARRWSEFAQRLEQETAAHIAEMQRFTGKLGTPDRGRGQA